MVRARNFADYQIRDNQTSYGGKSHSTETLGEFIADVDQDLDTDMEIVNIALTECGCEPIPYSGMKNCRYAVRFPKKRGLEIDENGEFLYFASPTNAFASADRLKEKYKLKNIDVEDLVTGMTVTTIAFTEC